MLHDTNPLDISDSQTLMYLEITWRPCKMQVFIQWVDLRWGPCSSVFIKSFQMLLMLLLCILHFEYNGAKINFVTYMANIFFPRMKSNLSQVLAKIWKKNHLHFSSNYNFHNILTLLSVWYLLIKVF